MQVWVCKEKNKWGDSTATMQNQAWSFWEFESSQALINDLMTQRFKEMLQKKVCDKYIDIR